MARSRLVVADKGAGIQRHSQTRTREILQHKKKKKRDVLRRNWKYKRVKRELVSQMNLFGQTRTIVV